MTLISEAKAEVVETVEDLTEEEEFKEIKVSQPVELSLSQLLGTIGKC